MKNKIIILLSIFILVCFAVLLVVSNKKDNVTDTEINGDIVVSDTEDNSMVIESTEDIDVSNTEDIIYVGTTKYTASEYSDMVNAAIEHIEDCTRETFVPKTDVDKVYLGDTNVDGEFVNMPEWLRAELVFNPGATLNLYPYAVAVYLYGDSVVFEESERRAHYSYDDGSYTQVYKVNGIDTCFTFTENCNIVYVYNLSDELNVVE